MNKEDTAKLILFLCNKDSRNIKPMKVYFDQNIKEGIIYGDPNILDQIWNIKTDGKIFTFTPNENFKKFDKIVKESNLIYQNEGVTQ